MRLDCAARRPLFAGASLALALLWSTPAQAWVCGRVLDNSGTPSGAGLVWAKRELTYSFSTAGTQADVEQSDAFAAVRAAFAVWQRGQPRSGESANCSGIAKSALPAGTDITFTEGPASDQNFVGYNYLNPSTNRNMVFFRDSSWPHPLTGATSELIGTTTVTYNNITGEILDADIEFNSADFTLSVGDDNVAWDLLNTAVHEVGHFLGFADSKAPESAMFGTTAREETRKRSLSCDDAAILWYRYPKDAKTAACPTFAVNEACGFCAPPGYLQFDPKITLRDAFDGRSGCSCASAQGAVGFVATALALTLRLARRRRSAKAD